MLPYGIERKVVDNIIQETEKNRPEMLINFGKMFFFQNTSEAFMEWFFLLGLQAGPWSTAMIAATWLREEELFYDIKEIVVPTLILHGIHDKICLFELAKVQNEAIKNSKMIPFQYSGHGLFYDERDKFNYELIQFIEGDYK